jgi:hypothetical protein
VSTAVGAAVDAGTFALDESIENPCSVTFCAENLARD